MIFPFAIFTLFSLPPTVASAQSNFWTSTGGPMGGDITSIISDTSSQLFAAHGDNGSLYRSTDNGLSWVRVASFGGGISALGSSPDGSILAGTGSLGIQRSTDGGVSWLQGNTGAGALQIRSFVALSESLLYAGTSRGILTSHDSGATWQTLPGPASGIYHLSVDNLGSLIAATTQEIFFSTDSGMTWKSIGFPPTGGILKSLLAYGDKQVYCGIPWGGFFTYSHVFEQWIKASDFSTYNSCLALTANGTMYLGADDGLYKSSDLGTSWTVSALEPVWVRSVFTGPTTVAAGTYLNGIIVSNDGGISWDVARITSTNVLSIVPLPTRLVASEENIGVILSPDGGSSWFMSDLRGRGISNLMRMSEETLLAAKGYSGIFRSTNGGINWSLCGLPEVMLIRAFAKAPNGAIYVGGYNVDQPLYRSTNGGDSWQVTNFNVPFNSNIDALSVTADGTVLVGTQFWGVYRSTNGTTNWVQSGLEYRQVTALLSVSSGIAFAGAYGNGVFRSTDDGISWSQVYPTGIILSFAADRSGNIFAALLGDDPIVSTDSGSTWITTGTGIPARWINCLASSQDGYLFAGTDDGLYRSISTTVFVPNQEHRDITFSMSQNYPNPFNSVTNIQFELPSSGHVVLEILDVLGRRLALLIDGPKGHGKYNVPFEARFLPTGSYFYRINVNNHTQTRRMLILK